METVVEGDRLPITLPMAGLAFFPIRALMFVVPFVAGQTIRRGVFESRSQVTLFAFNLGMFSHQGEA
jgi:hypothetical protein